MPQRDTPAKSTRPTFSGPSRTRALYGHAGHTAATDHRGPERTGDDEPAGGVHANNVDAAADADAAAGNTHTRTRTHTYTRAHTHTHTRAHTHTHTHSRQWLLQVIAMRRLCAGSSSLQLSRHSNFAQSGLRQLQSHSASALALKAALASWRSVQ